MKTLSVILLSLAPILALAGNPGGGGISKADLDAAIAKEDIKVTANTIASAAAQSVANTADSTATTNATSITSNASSISTNTAGRATNTTNISTNTASAATNATAAAAAQTKANSANTTANDNTIGRSTNTSSISNNGGNITTNTSNISTNTNNISAAITNATEAISTNTNNISSNTSSVAAINYLKLDNPDWVALALAAGVTLSNGGIVDCQGASGSLLTSCNKFENFFKDSSIAVRYLFGPSANQITYIKQISLDYSDSDTFMRVENATGTYLGCTVVTPRGKHPTSYGHNSYVTRAHSFNTGANSTFYLLNYPPQGGAQAVDYTFYIICQKVDGTAIGSGEITYFIS